MEVRFNSIHSGINACGGTSEAGWRAFLGNKSATAICQELSEGAMQVEQAVLPFFEWMSRVEQGDVDAEPTFPWKIRDSEKRGKDVAPLKREWVIAAPRYCPQSKKEEGQPMAPESAVQAHRPGFVVGIPSLFKGNPYADQAEKQKVRDDLMRCIGTIIKGVFKQDLPDAGKSNNRHLPENKRCKLLICLNRPRSIDDAYNDELEDFVKRDWSASEKQQLNDGYMSVQLLGAFSMPKKVAVRQGAVYIDTALDDQRWNMGRSLFNLAKTLLGCDQTARLRNWIEGDPADEGPLSFRTRTQLTEVRSLLSGAICPKHIKDENGHTPFEQAFFQLRQADKARLILAAVMDDDGCSYSQPWCHLASADVNSALMDAKSAQKGKYRAPGIFHKVEVLLRDPENQNLVLLSPGYTLGGERCSMATRMSTIIDQHARELLSRDCCFGTYLPEPALFRVYQPEEGPKAMNFSIAPSEESKSPGEYLPLLGNMLKDGTLSPDRKDQVRFFDCCGVQTFVPKRALKGEQDINPDTFFEDMWDAVWSSRYGFQNTLTNKALASVVYRHYKITHPEAAANNEIFRELARLHDGSDSSPSKLNTATTHLLSVMLGHAFFAQYSAIECPENSQESELFNETLLDNIAQFEKMYSDIKQDFENGTLYGPAENSELVATADHLFHDLKSVLRQEEWSAFFWNMPMKCLSAVWTQCQSVSHGYSKIADAMERNGRARVNSDRLPHVDATPAKAAEPSKIVSIHPRQRLRPRESWRQTQIRTYSEAIESDPEQEEHVEMAPPPRRSLAEWFAYTPAECLSMFFEDNS